MVEAKEVPTTSVPVWQSGRISGRDWRRGQANLPSRAEVIRKLVEQALVKGTRKVPSSARRSNEGRTMALLLRILGYGWLVLGIILIVLIYSVLFSARWPIVEDVIGAALILLPGFAAIALAAAVERRKALRLARGISQGRRV
ncbi:hypothetical protein RSO01_90810 [Reyranella soli]|uniref:Uncharacterized protein n=2 Tax=Reyranella soli TaxID=1230389 RepID=A0A512NSJ9_9HYPH|nr:hypothetical protein RSO01_90810 [Reyranella soli]